MPALDTSPAALVLERADRLAACSEEPGRLTRRFATPALAAAAGTMVLGSHLDTVRDAGRYDGMLGVLVALACVERLREAPFAVEVYGFADEEGVRYGTAYLGSSVVAGTFDAGALPPPDAGGGGMEGAISPLCGGPAG